MLLDASKPGSQPVQLADADAGLDAHDCFIGSDGNFHATKSLASSWPVLNLGWQVHSPITGQVLRSPHASPVFQWPSLVDPVHTTATRQLCMIDRQTFMLMPMGTSEEVARCEPCSGTFTGHVATIQVEWSFDEGLLAILYGGDGGQQGLDGSGRSGPRIHEVNIYDSATGDHLQSVRFWSQHAEMKWSESQNMLLVRSADYPQDQAPKLSARKCMVRVLHPLQYCVVAKEMYELQATVWQGRPLASCTWHAHGTLLVLFNKVSRSSMPTPLGMRIERDECGTCFFDPRTLQGIYRARDQPIDQIVWASVPAQGNQKHAQLAFLPFHRILASFCCLDDGAWHVRELSLAEDMRKLERCPLLSPCGSRLISLDPVTPCYYEDSFQVLHHLTKSQRQLGETKVPHSTNCGHELTWAPFPAAWQSVYVCNSARASTVDHPTLWPPQSGWSKAGPCVQFVDVHTSKTLCSWTLSDLVQQAGHGTAAIGSHAEMQNHGAFIGWSKDRRHLAIHVLHAQIAILTFGDA